MGLTFTGIFEKGEKYYIGYCLEIPEANGQGRTLKECKESLIEAIKLVIKTREEEGLLNIPEDAVRETLEIK
ncbi:MAG TPA: type II toxin-antitoxin system HicB family antitoxin [Candidatus Ratteibacteria bacterium]|nr:type II toxin-antitoxin system HicB family antitoxin [Candidatus Ratteibacteria bacterium]